jgi:predicted NAD/FAD-binding protein
MPDSRRLKIAVIGTGISGLSAAWLLSQRHDITVYEQAGRIGGHSNTILASIDGRSIPVDTGFIVFNQKTYPNLTALFEWLAVPTQLSNMSLSVSLDNGELEYSGTGLSGLFAQRRNLIRPRFWSMLTDLFRFYRQATADAHGMSDERISLGDYLDKGGFGAAFRDDHLLPMASAIWSASPTEILSYPAAAFIRFQANHGLLQATQQPVWETVVGGSKTYVERLSRPFADRIERDTAVVSVRRFENQVFVTDTNHRTIAYDHAVMAAHADQSLAMLADASARETQLLGAFRYNSNLAVLHSDPGLMPRRRAVWSSWNYIGSRAAAHRKPCVTYWMNRLQNIESKTPLFVSLNPPRPPQPGMLHRSEIYDHPMFDADAMNAQHDLWSMQGERNTWFCGAYFGSGFHEDGLQAGLAVAEQLGSVRRPWTVPNESGRIYLSNQAASEAAQEVTR